MRDENPSAEWRAMAGIRDRLIHDHFGVDLDILWRVVQSKIPALQHELRSILGAGSVDMRMSVGP